MAKEKDSVTPSLEPAFMNDEEFIEQVKRFIKKDDFVYLTLLDDEVLIDKQMIPIFDIKPAGYGIVSNSQLINSKTYLRSGVATLKRLIKIIDKRGT